MTADLDDWLLAKTQRVIAEIVVPERERWYPRRRGAGVWPFVAAACMIFAAILVGQGLSDLRAVSASASPTGVAITRIAVPGGAWDVALDVKRRTIVATGSDVLLVLDARTASVTNSVSLPHKQGAHPGGKIAIVPSRSEVLVTDFVSDRVIVVSTESARVVGSVDVGRGPTAIATDDQAGLAYVANVGVQSARAADARPGSVSVIDVATHRVVGVLALDGHPVALALDPGHGRLYVGQLAVGASPASLVVFDTTTQKAIQTILGDPAVALAVAPQGGELYVLQRPAGDTGTRLAVLPLGAGALRGVVDLGAAGSLQVISESRDETLIYATRQLPTGSWALVLLRHALPTNGVIELGRTPVGADPGVLAVDTSLDRTYVASRAGQAVLIVPNPAH